MNYILAFTVGQKVTYRINDFDGHNEYTGTIKEIHSDHIIVDCPGISDHLWFDDDNMDMLRKENCCFSPKCMI